MEVLRAGEKLAKKQKAEEEEMRWQQAQMHTHEPTSLQVERPWTISALSIPAYVAVCGLQCRPTAIHPVVWTAMPGQSLQDI